MKSEQEKNKYHTEHGNVMVYILIAIALIGGLTMTLSRQNEQSDTQNIDDELLEFRVTRILNYAASAQNVVNQMIMTGSESTDLIFDLPNISSFNTAPYIHKVYHPEGGGLIFKEANPEIFTGTDNDPDPGWYMGRFNNVEWTTDPLAQDVILTAHQISQQECENINKKITGNTTIPAITTGTLADYLISDTFHTGTNAEFTAAVCPGCDGFVSLCISNTAMDMWSYYIILEGK